MTISTTGQRTIERALASGWVHGNRICGPGRFLKMPKAERAELRKMFALKR